MTGFTNTPAGVAVVGGGAMGGMIGARLAAAGHAVLIIDIARSVVDAVVARGLTLETAVGAITTQPAATSDPAGSPPADFLFILVKGHQTSDAARLAEPLMGAATTVVTLQNGWGNAEEIAQHVAPEQLVIGVTYTSATLLGPAHVRAGSSGPTYLGPYDEGAGRGRSEAVATPAR